MPFPEERMSWLDGVLPQEMRRIVDTLYHVHRLIAVVTDLDELLELIMEEGKQVALAEACSLILFDPDKKELYFQVALGEKGDMQALKREIRLKLGQGIAGLAAAERRSINVADARSDRRVHREADMASHVETRSILAVPMLDREKLIGVIEVLNKVGDSSFTETDRRVMEMFASLAASVLSNARLIELNMQAARLAAIGQAVAGVSHYTKNIITGLNSSIDLLDQGLELNDEEVIRKTWPILKRSARRMTDCVEDMLVFSRRRAAVFRSCDIGRVFEEVADTFNLLLAKRNVSLELDTSGVKGSVFLNSESVLRCLVDIVINAAEAMGSSGGAIRLSARTLKNGFLEIVVDDDGPGIPQGMEERIFEPFFSTKGARGTGLGLAVTRKIVCEHNGTITAVNRKEGGARFTMLLPNHEPKR